VNGGVSSCYHWSIVMAGREGGIYHGGVSITGRYHEDGNISVGRPRVCLLASQG
jgi:hypothetical protein